jgi:formiminotetrahydrofolate cyclodeaminase
MLNERTVGEFLAALGERSPAPASGGAAALTGALAAALTEMAARFAEDIDAVVEAKSAVTRLVELADEDAAAYAAYLADRNAETQAGIVAVPAEVAAISHAVAELADRVRARLGSAVEADAEIAGELARAAARSAGRLAELNR